MDAVGRLASGIAHDFNNLLVSVLGGSEHVLEELPEDHPLREEVEEIRAAGDRGAKLVRQLLAFGRKGRNEPVRTTFNEGVEGLEKLLRRTIGEQIGLTFVPSPHPLPILIDVTHLEQIVMNLALNARDSMPDGGQLQVEVHELEVWGAPGDPPGLTTGRWACLVVQDTGAGMSPEVKARIFEPFFTTKAPGKGTGLGLATVFGIVREAQGIIEVESEVGRGSMFKVFLPAAPDGAAGLDSPCVTQAPARGRGEKVLLVEDDADTRRMVRQMLTWAGYAVVEAASPADALEQSLQAGADAVLTDMVMPGMAGHELAARLGQERPDLPMLFMSGYTDPDSHLPAGSTLLRKPFTRADLALALGRLLASGREEAVASPSARQE
jgi:CheY-like chemotaxis protein